MQRKQFRKEDEITYMEVLNKGLEVMDLTAITLCMDNNIPIRIFNINNLKNLEDVLDGMDVGTIIK